MPTYTRVDGASIYYEEHGSGSGFPLLLLSPGGLNSTIAFWSRLPFNPVEIFPADGYRVIAMDQRNAGRSVGPLEADDPWGMYADDQLGLLDHLGIDQALVLGCCIGCSFIFKLLQRQPQRIVAGVLEQPIGLDHTNPGWFGERVWKEWAQELVAKRPELSWDTVEKFCRTMWAGDFVISVPKEFLSTIQTPLLVLPGIDMAHPTGVGLEVAKLLPRAELLEKWKEPPEIVPHTIEAVRRFLRAHTPMGVA
jgi:pimeloyl-ACP methyl ester carboxylesterase